MKIISDISVDLVTHEASDARIVAAARVSTVGEAAQAAAAPGLIGYLMRHRHGSPFEHSMMTFRVHAPIFVWREHMRHRHLSYNEESGRYKQLDPTFYMPDGDRLLVQEGKASAYTLYPGTDTMHETLAFGFEHAYLQSYRIYEGLLETGVAREVARMVLPVGIFSTGYVTGNARAFMHFISLRTHVPGAMYASHPMYEIEMVAAQYELALASLMPATYDAFCQFGRVAP